MAYVSVTRAQFRSLLLDQLDNLGTAFYRVDELNKIIQSGLRFWNLLTGYWKTRATFTTTANQLWYALPNAITSQMRVTFQSVPLSPSSLFDLDFGRPAWRSETTTSGGDVPTQPRVFIVGALNLVALWPTDAAGNKTLTVDGLAATPILTADSGAGGVIDIGQDEFSALLDYCQHMAAFKQGGVEFKASDALMKSFLQTAAERSSILKESAAYRKYMGLDKGRMSRKMIRESDQMEAGAR